MFARLLFSSPSEKLSVLALVVMALENGMNGVYPAGFPLLIEWSWSSFFVHTLTLGSVVCGLCGHPIAFHLMNSVTFFLVESNVCGIFFK